MGLIWNDQTVKKGRAGLIQQYHYLGYCHPVAANKIRPIGPTDR